MTVVGGGGVVITSVDYTKRFKKDFSKLDRDLQDAASDKIKCLQADPRPPGLVFEKLKGYSQPSLYTIHVTGNYKISMEIIGSQAILRRIACHNEIDRHP